MRKIKEVLRLNYDAHLSSRKIAKSCNISPATVFKILKAAEAAGVTWPLPEGLDDAALENMLYTKPNICNVNRPAPDLEYIHRELKRKHVTLTLLWHEYEQAHPDGLMLSQYCELPQVAGKPGYLHAPGPQGRREAVRRLGGGYLPHHRPGDRRS